MFSRRDFGAMALPAPPLSQGYHLAQGYATQGYDKDALA
jgi:hypothetical protein